MKKMLCLLLCGIWLLAGCNQGADHKPSAATPTTGTTATVPTTVATTTTPATTVTTEPVTTTTVSEAEEWERIFDECIEEFLQAWQAGDADGMERYAGSKDMANLLAEEVTVEAYRVEKSTDDKPHRLYLSVSESSVPSVPKGESEWWIRGTDDYDGVYVELCPIDEDYTARWANLSTNGHLVVLFCNRMAIELELFDTVEDYSRMSPEELGAKGGALMRTYNGWLKVAEVDPDLPYHRTVPELSWFTERVLGVNVTDFSASDTYEPATETEEAQVGLGSPGGKWCYAGLVDHTEEGGTHTVTLCYYADVTRLVEAVTVRYTVQNLEDGMFRLISSQRLSGGTYPPARGTT